MFQLQIFLLHCDEWGRVVALPRHKFVTGATLLQLDGPLQTLRFLFWYEIQNGGYGRTYFNIEPYGGKVSKHFFSETFWTIETKLPRNVHWMVLYKLYVFCSDMKFKMVATAGLSLTLDPLGKMFKNASSLKPLGQLKPNCPGMIIGRSSTKSLFFMPIGNPRWPPPQDID